ncbi:hypothetical protein MesoLj113a_44900 [Mesorhizobium sp. 113-1-2]|uniref:SH3 domain-containing protein n=1 Tax=Mesorhizobium sp. 113-1-2 TaxID=2744515 RepID=UPI0008197BC4|nr:SH3 domain-containing protein [Mesorhizobium sp. 113-1-2]BAV45423.1 Uncharacterized protein MLTONO_0520 [Mesorhizobium loti]BCG73332.1 hypothetical protein MesoLj113a_44900 [Mesorhizobium sp. 113-1-2]
MVTFSGPPASAIRNLPISDELKTVLEGAGNAVGIDEIRIVSGGQPAKGEGTRRTGSTRHDHGRAADLQLIVGGAAKTFSDNAADPVVSAFVTACAARGATGIGAGVGYMGDRTIHVGFGTSVDDRSQLTWGAGGKSVNAPRWLTAAAEAGWNSAKTLPLKAEKPGRYQVIARSGLKLRLGPGTEFEAVETLPLGTELTVVAFESENNAWAKVDLQGDGLLDGHVLATFLAPVDNPTGNEAAPEPEAA